jgi:UDP-N-acetylmuramoyl-L-alanyl-D-glutamate--2,6-diaminopimelate ligase
MKLSDLLALLGHAPGALSADLTAPVKRVVYDSRQAGPGDVFAALPGTRVDGHEFLAQVAGQGALAALVTRAWHAQHGATAPLPVIPVEDTREAMAKTAAELHGHPSRQLKLVGVTGTNGKTTTTHLIRAVLEEAGMTAGLLGTLGADFAGQRIETGHTTPQSPEVQSLLSRMVDAGVQAVAMEVSSHAIDQKRVFGCAFQVAVHTNVTQDHLDYHGTMAAYVATKTKLFNWQATGIPPQHAVINLDDGYASQFQTAATCPVITYGIEAGPSALLWASDVQSFAAGSRFNVHWQGEAHAVSLPLPGRFNVYNALAAFATGLALGFAPATMAAALARVPGVPGRAEVVTPANHPFTVWVDYAHTPDGLVNVLSSARALNPRRLIVVFGCGGDRDRTKRPLMGEAAAQLADLAIVTSDNPRSEDPQAIIADILPGMAVGEHRVVLDREQAIHEAIREAGPGDLVVIAGKGHETYQIFADRTLHFDDREVARQALAAERPSAC